MLASIGEGADGGRMVMPRSRSRSRSFESMAQSATTSPGRKLPAWRKNPSTKVVFPWSTWATIAMLRTSLRQGTGSGIGLVKVAVLGMPAGRHSTDSRAAPYFRRGAAELRARLWGHPCQPRGSPRRKGTRLRCDIESVSTRGLRRQNQPPRFSQIRSRPPAQGESSRLHQSGRTPIPARCGITSSAPGSNRSRSGNDLRRRKNTPAPDRYTRPTCNPGRSRSPLASDSRRGRNTRCHARCRVLECLCTPFP